MSFTKGEVEQHEQRNHEFRDPLLLLLIGCHGGQSKEKKMRQNQNEETTKNLKNKHLAVSSFFRCERNQRTSTNYIDLSKFLKYDAVIFTTATTSNEAAAIKSRLKEEGHDVAYVQVMDTLKRVGIPRLAHDFANGYNLKEIQGLEIMSSSRRLGIVVIWSELIENGKGLKTVYDRPGFVESDYNFSAEMLEEMIHELDRLITKYSSSPWNTKTTANKLVSLITEHRALVQEELSQVLDGSRILTDKDFLGPKEREMRRKLASGSPNQDSEKDYSQYFFDMDRKLLEIRRKEMRKSLYRTTRERKSRKQQTNLMQMYTGGLIVFQELYRSR
eukprot:scaffold8686_cov122-Skeletonema_menzelii.AAC.7